ncbi:MAG: serine/threonine-protein kinase [Planctomycetota bacterium]
MEGPPQQPEARGPGPDERPTLPEPSASAAADGGRIGPYHLLSVIGEGGFGVVWEAEQSAPVRRRVAVKVIKPGMDSSAVVARFEAERQALAVMDHPCIAKVFDGGTSPAAQGSRPYFVMELVRGDPITAFCDRHKLDVEERVRLFVRVCEAVQHAHTKGVVHRDLKPSNVLVQYQDGKPTPKVIDFGVAKALNQRLSEQTIFTERGQLIGTPEYMSPEQAEMSGVDIDTRSDVYSLGVVLYELLTGMLPFDAQSLRSAGYAEIQRIIREVEPPKPSTRLSARTGDAPHDRGPVDREAVSRTLRRDLDWVVMKCLEKTRDRRYGTAIELASELKRFLAGEPVEAGPPTARYRLRRYVTRHKGPIAVGGVVAAVLLLGLVGTGVGLVRAERALAEAASARLAFEREAEEVLRARIMEAEARDAATAERGRAEGALGFFIDGVIESVGPDRLGPQAEVRDVLVELLTTLEAGDALDDLTARRVRVELAIAFNAMERSDLALRALAPFEEEAWVSGEASRTALGIAARGERGAALVQIGDPEAAAPVLLAAARDAEASLGRETEAAVEIMANYGVALRMMGDLGGAELVYREAVERWTALEGEGSREALKAQTNLVSILLSKEDPSALDAAERSLELLESNRISGLDLVRYQVLHNASRAYVAHRLWEDAILYGSQAASGIRAISGRGGKLHVVALSNYARAARSFCDEAEASTGQPCRHSTLVIAELTTTLQEIENDLEDLETELTSTGARLWLQKKRAMADLMARVSLELACCILVDVEYSAERRIRHVQDYILNALSIGESVSLVRSDETGRMTHAFMNEKFTGYDESASDALFETGADVPAPEAWTASTVRVFDELKERLRALHAADSD